MKRYTPRQLNALLNFDGMLPKKPFASSAHERVYYARMLENRLWKYLKKQDWQRVKILLPKIKIPQKTKWATELLTKRHAAS